MKLSVSALLVLLAAAAASLPRPASAQQYIMSGSAQAASGIEGNGTSTGAPERARTRVRLGLDLRVDENPKNIFGGGLIAEIEPHAAAGMDIRFSRAVGTHWLMNLGAIGFVAPQSLFGPSVGCQYLITLSPTSAFAIGPEANVFVLGGDLPSGTIIWQGLLQGGIRVDL